MSQENFAGFPLRDFLPRGFVFREFISLRERRSRSHGFGKSAP